MSAQEYRQKDLELLEMIAFYDHSNAEHEKEIAVNNLNIMELERKRLALNKEFNCPPPQRNLQGQVIKKEAA